MKKVCESAECEQDYQDVGNRLNIFRITYGEQAYEDLSKKCHLKLIADAAMRLSNEAGLGGDMFLSNAYERLGMVANEIESILVKNEVFNKEVFDK